MTSTTSDRIDGLTTTTAMKAPVYVATTANITLHSAQTIDGVAITTQRVLVKDQTDPVENGIYDASATSEWQRALDFNGRRDAREGTLVLITDGTTNALTVWRVVTDDIITIGTTAIEFALAFRMGNLTTSTDAPTIQWLAFDLTGLNGVLTAANGLFEQVNPACTVLQAAASCKTASSTGGLIFDIHGDGTTILGNKITIDEGEISSFDAAAQSTIATSSFTSPWRMRIDCDDDGDGLATGPVVVMLKVRWLT